MKRPLLVFALAFAILSILPVCAVAADAKPNIVCIIADDVTYLNLSCYGETNIETPNIDRLAREGLRFTRAYSAMSMCVPFRTELYTGLYPVRSGVARNHIGAIEGTLSVFHHLPGLGYRAGIAGKAHVKPASSFPYKRLGSELAGGPVRDFITSNPKQPFCLFLGSQNAHPPWRSGDISKIDQSAVKLPPIIHDNPPIRETYCRYLAEILQLDREVGEILQLLEETGRARDTLVLFTSEQGWDFAFGKWTCWDVGLHTALIARWPGHVAAATESDALIQVADIVPTLIEAAGGNPTDYNLDGRSFLPVLLGRSDTHREYVYGIHNNIPEGRPYPIRSIRDKRFHYIVNLLPDETYYEKHLMEEPLAKRYDLQWWQGTMDAADAGDSRAKLLMDRYHHRPAEELYLVDSDPYEETNLADDPKYADDKAHLRIELERWMKSQKDPGAAMDTEEYWKGR